jgi:hypothetical protein
VDAEEEPVIALHDGIEDHPKFVGLADDCFGLWVRGIGYCRRELTDGFIPEAAAIRRCRGRRPPSAQFAELCGPPAGAPKKAPLWSKVLGGYQVHDYLDWNPSAEEVETKLTEKRAAASLGGKQSGKSRRTKAEAKREAESKQDASVGLPSESCPTPSGNRKTARVISDTKGGDKAAKQAESLATDEARCFVVSSSNASPAGEPSGSGSGSLSVTSSPPFLSEGPDQTAAGGSENDSQLSPIEQALLAELSKHRVTAPIADERWVCSIAAGASLSRPIDIADVPEGVAWAVGKLLLDAPPDGAGLIDRAIADRVKSGLLGEATKRRNGRKPSREVFHEPATAPSTELLERVRDRVNADSSRILEAARKGDGIRW